jgi:hypothetical protein
LADKNAGDKLHLHRVMVKKDIVSVMSVKKAEVLLKTKS